MSSENVTLKKNFCVTSPKPLEVDVDVPGTHPSGILPEFVNIKEEPHSENIYTSVKIEPVDCDDTNYNSGSDSTESVCDPNWEVSLTKLQSQKIIKGIDEQGKEYRNFLSNEQMLYHTDDTPIADFTCPICFKTFANKHNVQRHIFTHKKQIYKCSICPREYKLEQQYLSHIKKHYTLKDYKCRKCDNIMKVPYHLQKNAAKRCCDDCRKANKEKTLHKKHILCPMCGKQFIREYLLKSHLLKHTTERPFTCDLCEMKFKHKSALIRHIQLHNGLKPFACKFCGKTFTHLGLMKPHMRCHTGEKPYLCPICKKPFAHKHNMQRHTLRHEKEKNLTCTICQKKFPKESRLRYHMRIHTSEKCFPCKICPKKFAYRQNIVRHYSKKHPDSVYDCLDTDASVARRIWDEVINKKKSEDDKITVKIERDEYIVPDKEDAVKEKVIVKTEIKIENESD